MKRAFSILSILAMLVAMAATIVVPVSAEVGVDIMEYDADAPQKAYSISSEDGWKMFVDLINTGMSTEGVTFTLTDDLDFEGRTDIATASDKNNVSYAFKGILDGNGKTMKNLSITGAGLFRYVGSSTFKNLKLDTISVNWNGKYGAVLGGQMMENAVVEVNNVDLVGCSFTCNSNGEGLLIGCAEKATLTVKNCDLLNCTMTYANSGTSYNAGFMIGTANTGTDSTAHKLDVENCTIVGCSMTSAKKVANLGWVCGLTEFVTIKNVVVLNNTATMQSYGNAAVLTGYTEKNGVSTITNAYIYNSGNWDYRGVDGNYTVSNVYTDINSAYAQTKLTDAYEMAWRMNTVSDTFAVSAGAIVANATYPTRKVTFGEEVRYTEANGLVADIPAVEGYEWLFDATAPITADTVVEARALNVEGDVNGDYSADAADVVYILQYINGNIAEINLEKADVTGDGKISLVDALRLLRSLNA